MPSFWLALAFAASELPPVEVLDSPLDDARGFESIVPAARGRSAADAIRGAPGVALRSLGGAGDFTTLSIRGATSTQIGIYSDGVALTQPGVGTVDLATLFLLGTAKLVVHRGFAPLTLGPEAFAGALELVSERPLRGGTASIAYGSFGMRELSYLHVLRAGRYDLSLAALYFGKLGDFPYLDNGATPLLGRDDAMLPRRNNDLDSLFARAELRDERLRLEGRVLAKTQGSPAPASNVQDKARYSLLRPQLLAAWSARLFDTLRLDTNVSALGTLARFSDLRPSLYSPATRQDTREISVRAHGALAWWIRAWLDLDAALDVSATAFSANAPGLEPAERGRVLGGGALVLHARFFEDRLAFDAGARVDVWHDGGRTSPSVLEARERVRIDQTRAFLQPQAGVSVTPLRGLAFSAHLARRERAPTFYELFGSDGQVRGNPALATEAQWSWDFGVSFKRPWLEAELVYAESRYDRLITLVFAGLDLPRAENIGKATTRSLELLARAWPLERWSLEASYTFQPTWNESAEHRGKPLSGRPLHQARAETAVHVFDLRASISVLSVSGLYLDTAATREVPLRVGLDAELAFNPGRGPVVLRAAFKNLLDQTTAERALFAGGAKTQVPIVDFLGFPLPGRSVLLTLSYAFDQRSRALGDSLCIRSC